MIGIENVRKDKWGGFHEHMQLDYNIWWLHGSNKFVRVVDVIDLNARKSRDSC